MTQADLAKETGLSTSKINDLIKGRINITPSTAKKLASIFKAPGKLELSLIKTLRSIGFGK